MTLVSAKTIARVWKPLVFAACLVPALQLGLGAFAIAGFSLGANPVEALLHGLGKWGLNLLLITLCVTPLTWIVRAPWPLRFRRMLGLFAFSYVMLHFLVYAILDQGLAWNFIVEDIIERPYITVGIGALLLLLPLALTSTRRAMRRLGRRWAKIHKLIYPISILGVWHYWWQVKQDWREPLVYASIVALLLGARLVRHNRRKVRSAVAGKPTTELAPGQSRNPI
jgi:sulfoxide reductase heme-binding subunit YedZ